MPIPVDLFSQIMSYNLDYQIFYQTSNGETTYFYPKRILKMFMFALRDGDDVLSTMIIKDARKKLKSAVLFSEKGLGGNIRNYIPSHFFAEMTGGNIKYHAETPWGYNDDITENVVKYLKPLVSVSRKGIDISFQAPELLQVSGDASGNSHYYVELQDDCSKLNGTLTFLSDWLFHFFVEGRECKIALITASSESFRIPRYKNGMNSSNIDNRNKRKKIKKMLESWKNKHPTLLGRMDIPLLIRKVTMHNFNTPLANIIYSL